MIVCTETVFTLHTTHTSYQLAVAPNGMVLHTYYGTRLPEDVPSLADARMPHSDPGCWPDLLPQELSSSGTADNRTPALTAPKQPPLCLTTLWSPPASRSCPACPCSAPGRV